MGIQELPNETVLAWALSDADLYHTRTEIPLSGVPGVTVAEACLSADNDCVEVWRLNDTELEEPMRVRPPNGMVSVTADDLLIDDGSVEGCDGVRWLPAAGGLKSEVQGVDAAGHDIVAQVDTDKYCWRMVCACGRWRYAKRNSMHQVNLCRVCTAVHKREYRKQWQRRKRSSSATPTT